MPEPGRVSLVLVELGGNRTEPATTARALVLPNTQSIGVKGTSWNI